MFYKVVSEALHKLLFVCWSQLYELAGNTWWAVLFTYDHEANPRIAPDFRNIIWAFCSRNSYAEVDGASSENFGCRRLVWLKMGTWFLHQWTTYSVKSHFSLQTRTWRSNCCIREKWWKRNKQNRRDETQTPVGMNRLFSSSKKKKV